MATFLTSAVLYVLSLSARSPSNWITVATVSELLGFLPFLTFPVVGAMIASKRPHNPIGWICLADGLLWNVLVMTDYYSRYGLAHRDVGGVVKRTAGQVLLDDERVRQTVGLGVHVVGLRGYAGGGEDLQGVVFVGGLLSQGEPDLAPRHQPNH